MNQGTLSKIELTLLKANGGKISTANLKNSVRITYQDAVANENLRQEYIDQSLWKETMPFIDSIYYNLIGKDGLMRPLVEIEKPGLFQKLMGRSISLNLYASVFNNEYIRNEVDFLSNLFNRFGYASYEIVNSDKLPTNNILKKFAIKNNQKNLEKALSKHRMESYAFTNVMRLKNSLEYIRFSSNNYEHSQENLKNILGHDLAIQVASENKPILSEKLYSKA
jgi:hypothetical protein